MTLRTITFDDSTHKLVPIIADESMLQKGEYYCESALLVWRDMIAAAPEHQEPKSAIAPDPRMNEPWTTEEKQDLNVTLGKIMNWNQDTKKDEP